MYEVVVEHYSMHYKKTSNKEKAIRWAEDAVYELGAISSAVYNPDGSILVQYEM